MGYVKSAAGPEILLGDLSSEDDQDEQAMSFPINAAYGAPRDGGVLVPAEGDEYPVQGLELPDCHRVRCAECALRG